MSVWDCVSVLWVLKTFKFMKFCMTTVVFRSTGLDPAFVTFVTAR